ncbi:MAG: YceI family protein [Saprospiraceae bacterium]|nr:YceI family protein [Saprospiraceae bacterium]
MQKLSVLLILVLGVLSMKPAPDEYKIDLTKSTFKWTGKKVTGSHWGYVKFSAGTLSVENDKLVGGTFTVDMNSIDCQDTKGEYGDKLVGHLKSEDFFGVAKNPRSSLNIISATHKGGSDYDIVANLIIKGISNEISFPATVTIKKKTVTAMANFNVNRTKFNIKYGSGSFFDNLGDKAIDDNFNVDVNIVAEQLKKVKKSKKKK